MSLRVILNNLIEKRGEVSYGEIAQICAEEGYKISSGERRLRQSESPFIEPVEAKSKRGTKYIKAYRWKPPVEQGQYVLPI